MLAVRFIMNFQEALKVLNIEDYAERIFKSNSHGELFHLQQYFTLAETFKDDSKWFREWFEAVVKFAERPFVDWSVVRDMLKWNGLLS